MNDNDRLRSGLPSLRKTAVKSSLTERWSRNIRNMLLPGPLRAIFDVECMPQYFDRPIEEKVKVANELNKARIEVKNEKEGDNIEPYRITVEDYTVILNKIEFSNKLQVARNLLFFKLYGGLKAREFYIKMGEKAEASKNTKATVDFLNFPADYSYRVQRLFRLDEREKKAEQRKLERKSMDFGEWAKPEEIE